MAKQKFKEFPNNPRRITEQRLLQLAESLAEYGSLDGFVVNRSPGKYKDCIVSGNQKNKHVNLSDAEIQITTQYDEPTAAGTLCVGNVIYKGERFPYREVSWSERKCEIANLRANNYGGENDRDLLFKFDSEVLEMGGVDMVFEEFKLSFDGGNDYESVFSLPEGDRAPFQQMTFTFADEQTLLIKNAISEIKQTDEFKYMETMGNENSNGNAIYLIVSLWVRQKK